ncbi:hypothetical protein PVK06_031335 [Gossypium arboreum]|uniref:Uncharacterized protein n=1 Tax=Gossypium arboreum TaxID=29729 RepID=A0ABR0NQU5_GOSAR|nr:hypothetical protein PVK06_031335 [Gossypium arboreum]
MNSFLFNSSSLTPPNQLNAHMTFLALPLRWILSLWNVLREDKGALIAIAANCPNLIALSIESCPKIGNEGLQAIEKLCPKLQSISIKDCPLVGDHGVSSLLSSASSVLSKVKLQGLSISDFSLTVIRHYGKSVINLILSGLQNMSKKGFWVMGNAQGLQKCCFVSSDGLVAFAKSVGSLECL